MNNETNITHFWGEYAKSTLVFTNRRQQEEIRPQNDRITSKKDTTKRHTQTPKYLEAETGNSEIAKTKLEIWSTAQGGAK